MNRKQRRTEAKLGQRTVPSGTVTALFAKAIGCHQAGRIAEAEALYAQILAIDPNNAETYSNLGMILKDRGELPEATACYRKTLALKPDHAPRTTISEPSSRTKAIWPRASNATAGRWPAILISLRRTIISATRCGIRAGWTKPSCPTGGRSS